MTVRAESVALSVDMVRCTGHGICAWIYPDRVNLDEWGFAHVDPTPVEDRAGRRRARRAERACPRRALLVSSLTPNRTAPTATRPTV